MESRLKQELKHIRRVSLKFNPYFATQHALIKTKEQVDHFFLYIFDMELFLGRSTNVMTQNIKFMKTFVHISFYFKATYF